MNSSKLPRNFYLRSAIEVAKDLLGKSIVRVVNQKIISAKIVEVEAYKQIGDEASHSFKGISKRNEVMFFEGGHFYVYFCYGIHYLCNVVTGKINDGAAVLIRGVEPIDGIDFMGQNRYRKDKLSQKEIINLTNGPAKICNAFGFDKKFNGADLLGDDIFILDAERISESEIVTTSRIGITKSLDLNWRFYIKDNLFVSQK